MIKNFLVEKYVDLDDEPSVQFLVYDDKKLNEVTDILTKISNNTIHISELTDDLVLSTHKDAIKIVIKPNEELNLVKLSEIFNKLFSPSGDSLKLEFNPKKPGK